MNKNVKPAKKASLSARRAKIRKVTGLPPKSVFMLVDRDGDVLDYGHFPTALDAAQAIVDEGIIEGRSQIRVVLYMPHESYSKDRK